MDIVKTESTHTYNLNHKLNLSSLSDDDLKALEQMGMRLTTNRMGIKQLTDNAGNN